MENNYLNRKYIYNKSSQGFTLIELLIVIAIIGILSAVVLASLNIARDRGKDAALKSSMDSLRAYAEVFYSSNGNIYTDFCDNNGTNFTDAEVDKVAEAIKTSLVVADNVTALPCTSTADSYTAHIDLHGGDIFCVDGRSFAGTIPDLNAPFVDGDRCQ